MLHIAELHALSSSSNIIRNLQSRLLKWAGHVARMELSRNVYKVLVGRPEGKRPLGRPRQRWENNIKTNFQFNSSQKVSQNVTIYTYLVQERRNFFFHTFNISYSWVLVPHSKNEILWNTQIQIDQWRDSRDERSVQRTCHLLQTTHTLRTIDRKFEMIFQYTLMTM